MATRILTIEIPDGEDVETTIEEVQHWLDSGMTSGFYPTWTLHDEVKQPTPEERAQQVLDNHVIRDDWRRTGAQIRGLIAEAIRLERGQA